MNIYALFPCIAVVAYIPLLITTVGSRPWQKRHTLFILFLVSAMLWSLTTYFFRGNIFPQHSLLLFKFIIIFYSVMVVQLHCFVSSFFPPGQGRWLPFAYGSLAVIIILVASGYVAGGTIVEGIKIHGSYRLGTIFVFLPLISLGVRNIYVLGKRLRVLDNPVLYNQLISLVLAISVLTIFTLMSFLPLVKDYPVSHLGNLFNAFILSYATIRHRLVDIRIVLRQGSAWIGLGLIGLVSYWLLLMVLHSMLDFQLDLTASLVATTIGLMVAIFIYRLRGSLFELMSRVFQGPSYDDRQKLSEFANTIHNVFSLKEQGGELLALLTKAIGIKQACLLFPEVGSEDFNTQFTEPKSNDNKLHGLKMKCSHPVAKYLEREQKILYRDNLAILPEFLGMWEQEREEIKSREIEIFMPLISRDRLIAILVLGGKQSGRYSLEDFHTLEEVASRVAVSIEKEYLREQLREREEELSVINRSSAIMTSSLDIQEIYGSFIEELKRVVDVSWAAIVLMEESGLCFLALSSEIHTDWQVGEKVPTEDSGTGWVIAHKEVVYEPDIEKESRFDPSSRYLQWGLRSIVHLPLLVKGEAIGSFIVASRRSNAFSQRDIMLLEQLAAHIAMPIGNAQIYAKAEEKARNDELTGLYNRRSLDEMIDNEISRHSRYGGVFSLSILDLDSFKTYNDSYGHLAGDRLLRQVGRIIKGAIRSADQAFRYGGDEFAILLPQTDIEAAIQVTERVRKRIAQETESGEIPVTASIGVAGWPADGVGHTDIIAAADLTLYRAKRSGGNRTYSASGNLFPFGAIELSTDTGLRIDSKDISAVYELAQTVDDRTHGTGNHSKKVAEYALALAEALNLEETEMSRLETCALLHDIGKIGISDEILNKSGKLTAEEWESVKIHPQVGANIVNRIPQFTPCVAGILHHHECYDGSGYPKGLKGNDIPLEARILAVADAFTAMTSERSHADTLTIQQALEEIKQGAGKQFDPSLVGKFLSVCEKRFMVISKKGYKEVKQA
jgi:diguanylate cyclase (GGDEF)-like protein/putative nucleotidyltransferase with HDIG domain